MQLIILLVMALIINTVATVLVAMAILALRNIKDSIKKTSKI